MAVTHGDLSKSATLKQIDCCLNCPLCALRGLVFISIKMIPLKQNRCCKNFTLGFFKASCSKPKKVIPFHKKTLGFFKTNCSKPKKVIPFHKKN